MSGLFKAIGKVFRKVAKVVKTIAVPLLIAGAVIMTGGALLGAAPLLGAGGVAAGAAGTAAGGGLMASMSSIFGGIGTGLSSVVSSVFGGGVAAAGTAAAGTAAAGTAAAGGSFLGTVLSSPVIGGVISGAATGYASGLALEEKEQQAIRAEDRTQANYDGVGAATDWKEPEPARRGLGMTAATPPQTDIDISRGAEIAAADATGLSRMTQRPGLNVSQNDAQRQRAKYDREAGRIIYS